MGNPVPGASVPAFVSWKDLQAGFVFRYNTPMPASPKTPLSVRLRALGHAVRWVLGNQADEARHLRHLSLQLGGMAPVMPVTDLGGENKVPLIELGPHGLPLLAPDILARWQKTLSPGEEGDEPTGALLAADPRWRLLVVQKKEPLEFSRRAGLIRTLFRMSWRARMKNPQLLGFAEAFARQCLPALQGPGLDGLRLEAALSMEEAIAPIDMTLLPDRFGSFSEAEKVWLAWWVASLGLPVSVLPPSPGLARLDRGFAEFSGEGFGWLEWNALFNNEPNAAAAIKGGLRAHRKTSLPPDFAVSMVAEYQRWRSALDAFCPIDPDLVSGSATPFESEAMGALVFQDQTPLFWATLTGGSAVVPVLLRHGANPDIRVGHWATPLALALLRCQPALVTSLLDAGAPVISGLPPESEVDRWYASSPLFALGNFVCGKDLTHPDYAMVRRICALMPAKTLETYEGTRALRHAFSYKTDKDPVAGTTGARVLGCLVENQPFDKTYCGTWRWSGLTEIGFLFKPPVKVEHLKVLGKGSGVRLGSHLHVSHDKWSFGGWLLYALLYWAPEALEDWIKTDIASGTHHFSNICKRTDSHALLASMPRAFIEALGQDASFWEKGEHVWLAAARSTNPRLALGLLAQYAPKDLLHTAGQTSRQDLWEALLERKGDDRLVEWTCQTLGGPKWGPTRKVSELSHWLNRPRNEDEIESVLAMNLLPLNLTVDGKENQTGTVLHQAAASNDPWLVQTLLRHGADPDLLRADGKSAGDLIREQPWGEDVLASGLKARLDSMLVEGHGQSLKKRL